MGSEKVFLILTVIMNMLIFVVYSNTSKSYSIDFDYFLLEEDEDLPDTLPSN